MKILEKVITDAVTAAVSDAFGFSDGVPLTALIQGELVYGSGGTTLDAWVQTSIDGGETWIDVCNFRWTTAGNRRLYNLSADTPITTVHTATDGTLAANTAKDGVIGRQWRVKYTSTGDYADDTTLKISVHFPGASSISLA
jgi:hypothetical protein